jgi:flagellin
MTTAGLSLNTVSVSSGGTAAIATIDAAIKEVSEQRSDLGAVQNRLEHTLNNLGVSVENLSAAESRIRDTDMASQMVEFTRSQILSQAGTSMLSQANQSSQNVLSLLR